MIAGALIGAVEELPLLRALEPHAPWMLAWLAAAALVALRRRAARSPGALGAWLPILAFGALLCFAAPPLRFGTSTDVSRAEPAKFPPEPLEWNPRVSAGGPLVAPESWRELLSLLARGAGAPVSIRADPARPAALEDDRVPHGWRLPSGASLALSTEGGLASPVAAEPPSWLEHAAFVPPRRSLRVDLRAATAGGVPNGDYGLQVRTVASPAWRELGRVTSSGTSDRAIFESPAPEPGAYAVRVIELSSQRELARSALQVRAAPRARLVGGGLEALAAALRAQGYDVREEGAVEAEDEVVLVGTGAAAFLAAPELVSFVEEGGGLFLAHPEAWQAAQDAGWAERLPARLRPEAPPAETPERPREEEPRAEEPIDAPPQREEAPAGRFALFVVLDLSGSFEEAVPEAWAQIAAALRAAEGFELVGIAGFNVEARLLLPLAAHGERLDAALEAVRPRLRSYVESGGRQTYVTPALRLAADELAREAPSGALIVVVSDGIFDDRPEQGGDWKRFAESVLALERGYALAAIRIADRRHPASVLQRGQQAMDSFAALGGTKRAVWRTDLGSALRLIPVVARDVQAASAWTPRKAGKKPPPEPRETAEPTVPPEAPAVSEAPLVPRPTGIHAAEGLPGELDAAPWPPLRALRRCALGSGAAPAWIVQPRQEPLLITGVHVLGRIALAAAPLDAQGWPGGVADPRFPLFAARVVDLLRRPLPEVAAWRARWRTGERLAEPRAHAALAGEWFAQALAGEDPGTWVGSARVDRAARVQSTLRASAPPVHLEGERRLLDVLREAAAGDPSSTRAPSAAPEASDTAPADWLAALGVLLGLALAMEWAGAIWTRSRAGAR
ncbi:MAG: VWA domain-containing protein [Planctomycetes bacterium]|nr:VWA domain-containing protein [Planctomycetota bacterium]